MGAKDANNIADIFFNSADKYPDRFALFTPWKSWTYSELFSIVNLGMTDPAVDTFYSSGTATDNNYWSGIIHYMDANYAWTVSFGNWRGDRGPLRFHEPAAPLKRCDSPGSKSAFNRNI